MQPTPVSTVRNRALLIASLIILLAAWLRLGAFQEALIGSDQSSILAAAADIAAGRDFPLVGIKSSAGVMQTAITPYLAAIPLLFLRRAIAVKWFFAVLDLLAIAWLWRAVQRVFGMRAASIATLLYAANPWVVEYNRWIWYQTLIPTFATLAFAALLLMLAEKSRRGELPLALIAATLMGMVHLVAIPWAAGLALIAAEWGRRRKAWRELALGIGACLLIVYPYGRYLIITDFADIRLMVSGGDVGVGEKATGLNWGALRLARELLSGEQVLTTPNSPLWAESTLQLPHLFPIIPALLALAGIWAAATLIQQRHMRLPLGFTLGWTLLAPLLFLRTEVHLQYFYLLFLFPAPYVMLGAACGDRRAGKTWLARLSQAALLALLLTVSLWWAYLWSVRIGLEQRGELRAPTRAWLMDRTVDVLNDYLESEPQGQVILINAFSGKHLSPFDWVRNFLHSDRVRVVDAGEGFIHPAGPTCYMLGPGADDRHLTPVAALAVRRPAMQIPARPPWDFACVPARAPLAPPLAEWQNGLSLLDFEIAGTFAPGETLGITYTWHYHAVADREYHFFNHLLQDNEIVAQVDGAGVPTWYWRDDDVLVTHFALPLPATLPAGTYRLWVGNYTWPQLERMMRVSGEDGFTITTWEQKE